LIRIALYAATTTFNPFLRGGYCREGNLVKKDGGFVLNEYARHSLPLDFLYFKRLKLSTGMRREDRLKKVRLRPSASVVV
jgi:hypothetical protein